MHELDGLLVRGVPRALTALRLPVLLDADVPAEVRPPHREVLQVAALGEGDDVAILPKCPGAGFNSARNLSRLSRQVHFH